MNKFLSVTSFRQGLRSFFATTSDSKDPSKLKDMLGCLIFLRVLILSAIFGFTCWSLFTNTSEEVLKPVGVFWTIGFIYAVSIVNAVLLRVVKNLKLFSYAQLIVDVILATLAISLTNSAVSIIL